MKRFMPWILGMIIGIVVTSLVGGYFLAGSFFSIFLPDESVEQPDVSYGLVRVSWGTPVSSPNLWIYQIQVYAYDLDHDGVYDVSAKACIGSSSYFHDFGHIGTATSRGEAVQNFGDITWSDDKVAIGGADGIKATYLRSELENHR